MFGKTFHLVSITLLLIAAKASAEPATKPTTEPPAKPATRAAVPDASAVKAAQQRLWREFKADYDSSENAVRKNLMLKFLADASAASAPAERMALLIEATDLAAHIESWPHMLQTIDATAKVFAIDPIVAKRDALAAAAGAKAGRWDRKPAAQLVAVCMDLCLQTLAAENVEGAAGVLAVAQKLAPEVGDAAVSAYVDRQARQVAAAKQWANEVDTARKQLADNPNDAKANLLVGRDAAARRDWATALPTLALGSHHELQMLAAAELKTQERVPFAGRVAMAERWSGASAAERRNGAVRVAAAFHARARFHLLAAAEADHGDKAEADRHLAALDLPDFAAIGAALAAGPVRSEQLGSGGGLLFESIASAGGVLVGFDLSHGKFDRDHVLISVEPVYLGPTGFVSGGISRHGAENLQIRAKPGYAVGAIHVRAGSLVDGMRIVFMRIHGDHLDPADSYLSEWLGGPGGAYQRKLGGDGKPVVGIFGRHGQAIDAIGVLQSP